MADELEISVDDLPLRKLLARKAAILRKDGREVVRQEMGLMAQEAAKLTPPYRSSIGAESWAEQKRVGSGALLRDIRRVFLPIEGISTWASSMTDQKLGERIAEVVRSKDSEALAAILGNMNMTFDPLSNDFDLLDHHNSQRTRRGRVPRGARSRFTGRTVLRNYEKRKLKNIGMAKGGWVAGMNAFGKKAPVWISRHSRWGRVTIPRGGSDIIDATIYNAAPNAANLNRETGFLRRVMRNRTAKVRKQVELLAAKAARAR